MTGQAPDVVVIGGGLHGCSTALHLARDGVRVTVIEKDYVGRHASGVNAGGVRRLGRDKAEIPLSLAAMDIWHTIRELVDDDCGFESRDHIKVAESEEELACLRRRADEMAALGFKHEELIGQEELRDLAPAISRHCTGAIICRRDGAALPFRTVMAFKRKAESLGVVFMEKTKAVRLDRRGRIWQIQTDRGYIEAAVAVNCAGAWADRIAAQLGEAVPLEVIAPMLTIAAPMAPFLRPVLGATARPLSFKQFSNGAVLIGGGHRGQADRDKNWTDLDFIELAFNMRAASDLFPVMRKAQILRCWAGIEARMPDDIPVIGASATSENIYHAFGFSAHGFQLGPIVGQIVAALIGGKPLSLPIAPFSIKRFHQRRAVNHPTQ